LPDTETDRASHSGTEADRKHDVGKEKRPGTKISNMPLAPPTIGISMA
jgi:hypothetical protein